MKQCMPIQHVQVHCSLRWHWFLSQLLLAYIHHVLCWFNFRWGVAVANWALMWKWSLSRWRQHRLASLSSPLYCISVHGQQFLCVVQVRSANSHRRVRELLLSSCKNDYGCKSGAHHIHLVQVSAVQYYSPVHSSESRFYTYPLNPAYRPACSCPVTRKCVDVLRMQCVRALSYI